MAICVVVFIDNSALFPNFPLLSTDTLLINRTLNIICFGKADRRAMCVWRISNTWECLKWITCFTSLMIIMTTGVLLFTQSGILIKEQKVTIMETILLTNSTFSGNQGNYIPRRIHAPEIVRHTIQSVHHKI